MHRRIITKAVIIHRPVYWLLFSLVLFLAACSGNEPEELPEESAEQVIADIPTKALPPANVTVSLAQGSTPIPTVEAGQPLTDPSLTVSQGESAGGAEATVAVFDSVTSPIPPSAEVTSTGTPIPTFTAPARPQPSPWDHYWFIRPVPEGSASWTDKAYPYGSTRSGQLRTHHGVEFNVPAGTAVLAPASGTVVVAGDDRAIILGETPDFYGQVLVLQHEFAHSGKPVYTLFGHLSEVISTPGQRVQVGEVIAMSGSSGVADGAHLHFEVRVGENDYDSTRNPLLWLYPFPDRGVVAGRVIWPDGTPARGAPVNLTRIDGPAAYSATTTYADGSVHPDENWGENFALDDVVSGYYRLDVGVGETKESTELWVYPGQTAFVEVVLSD